MFMDDDFMAMDDGMMSMDREMRYRHHWEKHMHYKTKWECCRKEYMHYKKMMEYHCRMCMHLKYGHPKPPVPMVECMTTVCAAPVMPYPCAWGKMDP